METNPQLGRSALFLVRLWGKTGGDSQTDGCNDNQTNQTEDSCTDLYGTVQHTISGRTREFRGWNGLAITLSEMLQTLIHSKRR